MVANPHFWRKIGYNSNVFVASLALIILFHEVAGDCHFITQVHDFNNVLSNLGVSKSWFELIIFWNIFMKYNVINFVYEPEPDLLLNFF